MRSLVQLERASRRTSSRHLLQRYTYTCKSAVHESFSECFEKENDSGDTDDVRVTIWFHQDVAAKIIAFANQSSRAVCVLSAMGSVSRVDLRHPGDTSPMSRVHTSQPYKSPAIYEVNTRQRNHNLNHFLNAFLVGRIPHELGWICRETIIITF